MPPDQSQRYRGLVQAITAQTASFTKSGLPADAAAKVIAKAVTARKPRTRYTIGRDAALLTRLARILARPDTRPRLCRRSASPLSQGEQMSTARTFSRGCCSPRYCRQSLSAQLLRTLRRSFLAAGVALWLRP